MPANIGGGSPGPQSNPNAEIYYPPYLYDASGGYTMPFLAAAAVTLVGFAVLGLFGGRRS